MGDETPTTNDLLEFGNPAFNATFVSQPGDVIQPDPEAAFTDEVPDLGLE